MHDCVALGWRPGYICSTLQVAEWRRLTMPRGSQPGERRGGRKKGTPDKATAERQAAMRAAVAECFATMTPAEIEALSPKEIMLRAMHTAAKSGDVLLAVNIAERAAPYYDRKLTGPLEVKGQGGGPIRHAVAPDLSALSDDELARKYREALTAAGGV